MERVSIAVISRCLTYPRTSQRIVAERACRARVCVRCAPECSKVAGTAISTLSYDHSETQVSDCFQRLKLGYYAGDYVLSAAVGGDGTSLPALI